MLHDTSAARLGAILQARFPSYWPETHRGLMVHAARWHDRMLEGNNPHNPGSRVAVERILRTYGYGEPNQQRLFGSGESGVTLIIQDTIEPYDPESPPGKASLGHFNLHDLPWPKDTFNDHPDAQLKLTATLSYLINPNPGSRCWDKSQKYRYASHLLRFNFKRALEDESTFRKALEKQIKDEEEENDEEAVARAASDPQWALGPQLRNKGGSLIQDIWRGSPAELAEMGQVAIYPAKGWFATRKFPVGHEFYNCHQQEVRYSLILGIDAEQDIGLYTDISNLISVDA